MPFSAPKTVKKGGAAAAAPFARTLLFCYPAILSEIAFMTSALLPSFILYAVRE